MPRSAIEYIERAAVFRRQARESTNPSHQQLLLGQADTCEKLARKVEGPTPGLSIVPSPFWSRGD